MSYVALSGSRLQLPCFQPSTYTRCATGSHSERVLDQKRAQLCSSQGRRRRSTVNPVDCCPPSAHDDYSQLSARQRFRRSKSMLCLSSDSRSHVGQATHRFAKVARLRRLSTQSGCIACPGVEAASSLFAVPTPVSSCAASKMACAAEGRHKRMGFWSSKLPTSSLAVATSQLSLALRNRTQ